MAVVPLVDRRMRVLIADDHSVVRSMVRSTLQQHPHIVVCGEAKDGAEAVELAKKIKPDVTVLNIIMPVLNGFDAAREIKRQVPQSAIVILFDSRRPIFYRRSQEGRGAGLRRKIQSGRGTCQSDRSCCER